MFRTLMIASAFALAVPSVALAQDHGAHDHAAHDHGAHEMVGVEIPDQDDIREALAAGGSYVGVEVLGVVCDFCATAMNRTFSRRDEVAAVYVDLDTKTMSLVLKEGQNLDDATIGDLVERAGYKVSTITRPDLTEANDAS